MFDIFRTLQLAIARLAKQRATKVFALMIAVLFSLSLSGASSADTGVTLASQMPAAATTTASTSNVDWSTGLSSDVSIGVLQRILGNWSSSTPDPTIGALFKGWNLGIMLFASFLFVAISAIATMHSAEDGELLGKQWGSPFTPLRMLAGMATLFPLANGFSTIQIIVLWLATNGVGFANWTVGQTMQSFANNQGSVLTAQLINSKALATMMTGILQAETCVAERNFELTDPSNPGAAALYGGPFVDQGTGTNSYGKAWWGPVALSTPGAPVPSLVAGASADMCGSIEIPNFNSSIFGLAGNGTGTVASVQSTTQAFLATSFTGQDLNLANTTLHQAHFNAILAAATKLRPAAQAFVSTTGGGTSGTARACYELHVNYRA